MYLPTHHEPIGFGIKLILNSRIGISNAVSPLKTQTSLTFAPKIVRPPKEFQDQVLSGLNRKIKALK